VNLNIYHLTEEERKHYGIRNLPANLSEALDELEADDVIKSALGEHIYDRFMTAKRIEWDEYRQQVQWELTSILVLDNIRAAFWPSLFPFIILLTVDSGPHMHERLFRTGNEQITMAEGIAGILDTYVVSARP
jgi:hypothetical protein